MITVTLPRHRGNIFFRLLNSLILKIKASKSITNCKYKLYTFMHTALQFKSKFIAQVTISICVISFQSNSSEAMT